jgi:hypothetical protein
MNSSGAHRPRKRPVDPHRLVADDEVAADEVRRGEVVVAGDGDERPREPPGHVLDEPRLAAAGRPLEQYRHARRVRGLEERDLLADRLVVGLRADRGELGLEHLLPRGLVHCRSSGALIGRCGRTDGAGTV